MSKVHSTPPASTVTGKLTKPAKPYAEFLIRQSDEQLAHEEKLSCIARPLRDKSLAV
jgi:hypothetical protein